MSRYRQRDGWRDLHLVSFVPRSLSASDLSDDNLVKSTSSKQAGVTPGKMKGCRERG